MWTKYKNIRPHSSVKVWWKCRCSWLRKSLDYIYKWTFIYDIRCLDYKFTWKKETNPRKPLNHVNSRIFSSRFHKSPIGLSISPEVTFFLITSRCFVKSFWVYFLNPLKIFYHCRLNFFKKKWDRRELCGISYLWQVRSIQKDKKF